MNVENFKAEGVRFERTSSGVFCGIGERGEEAWYPLLDAPRLRDIRYVMMDLDGTTVQSEEFWIYLIEKTAREITGNRRFSFTDEDLPFVSGFSTIEHLRYFIGKYAPDKDLRQANAVYHRLAEEELNEALLGGGNAEAFKPREGLKDFLTELKARGCKIGLATSGLDYKAIPEIVAAFRTLGMGAPEDFYDAIVTGGKRKTKGSYGTIGELAVKPHPWIYKELALGLGVASTERDCAVVIEDSSSGLISGRLAGFSVVGFRDGNIVKSGMESLTCAMADGFDDILSLL